MEVCRRLVDSGGSCGTRNATTPTKAADGLVILRGMCSLCLRASVERGNIFPPLLATWETSVCGGRPVAKPCSPLRRGVSGRLQGVSLAYRTSESGMFWCAVGQEPTPRGSSNAVCTLHVQYNLFFALDESTRWDKVTSAGYRHRHSHKHQRGAVPAPFLPWLAESYQSRPCYSNNAIAR